MNHGQVDGDMGSFSRSGARSRWRRGDEVSDASFVVMDQAGAVSARRRRVIRLWVDGERSELGFWPSAWVICSLLLCRFPVVFMADFQTGALSYEYSGGSSDCQRRDCFRMGAALIDINGSPDWEADGEPSN